MRISFAFFSRIGFFEGHIERKLDLVRQCVVGKQGSIFSKVRNVLLNIQYDSTISSSVPVIE